MMATRTLSSPRTAPFDAPFDSVTCFLHELLADVQDALDDRDPRGRSQQGDRPGEDTPRREDEAGGDDHDALGSGADADVALEAEGLRAGAGVGDEQRTGDRRDGDDDEDLLPVDREDVGDRSEHEELADAIGGRVEERAEDGRLAPGAGERAVEDVENRAGDEDRRAEPEEQQLVAPLEEDDDGGDEAERDAGHGERVGGDAGAGESRD